MTGPVRVLIVDDSDDQLLLLRRYFERAGCEVVVASTALDGIRVYGETSPDLTVIDLVLPGMDGWELAAQLSEEYPGCTIAITSVLGAEHYPADFATLPKPVTNAHVRRVLLETVPRWRSE